MIGYRRILRGYADGGHLPEPAPDVVAWLTGQSSHRHSQLSPDQLAVLDDCAGLGFRAVRAGFPYHREALRHPWSPEPLLAASRRNASQFVESLARPAFAREIARHLRPLVSAASRRLLLLCGSCGLQLFAAALPHLELGASPRIGLVAIGPACWTVPRHPSIKLTVVRGRRDWISHVFSDLPADARPPVGHMGYTSHPEGRRAIADAAAAFAA